MTARRTSWWRSADRLEDADAGGLGRDLDSASAGLRSYAAAEGPRVVFVGKLIVSKGCDLLLAAWPLVASRHPGARLMMVGFGEYRDGLARLWSALCVGRPRRRPRGRPARLGARGRGGGAAQLSVRIPRRPAGGIRRGGPRRRRHAGPLRPARVHRGRARRPQQRRDGRAEHVPRGVRHGRRRGRLDRSAPGLRPSLRPGRGRGRSRGRPAGRRRAPDLASISAPARSPRSPPNLNAWLALPDGGKGGRERLADGHRAGPLELGERRPDGGHGLRGRPRRSRARVLNP